MIPGRLPVVMGVNIDEARCDDHARGIDFDPGDLIDLTALVKLETDGSPFLYFIGQRYTFGQFDKTALRDHLQPVKVNRRELVEEFMQEYYNREEQ